MPTRLNRVLAAGQTHTLALAPAPFATAAPGEFDPWKMPYDKIPPAPGHFTMPEPARSEVTVVKEPSGETKVILNEADVRVLMRFLARNSAFWTDWFKRKREFDPPRPTEPAAQLEEWLHLYKTDEAERIEKATNASNFLAWFYITYTPPKGGEAKEAYDWMLQHTSGRNTDPSAHDMPYPSASQIMNNYDKWMDVYGKLQYYAA